MKSAARVIVSIVALTLLMVVTPVRGQTTATVTVLHNFSSDPDGYNPRAPLVSSGSGYFYGTTSFGGIGSGTVYVMDNSGVVTILHSFDGSDGFDPYLTCVIVGQDGNLYGTTDQGGANHDGTFYSVTPSGTFTLLHSFNGADGTSPFPAPGLLQTADGYFYGTTYQGGANDDGTVFRAHTSGAITTLHSFGGSDGSKPWSGLIVGGDGSLYGTTIIGGASNTGTIYKITKQGVLTTLYSFTDGTDGGYPQAGITLGADGNYYGTTDASGVNGHGTFYQFTPSGGFTVLHSFGGPDGSRPYAGPPLQGPDGNFYGTTELGGTNNTGTIYQISPTGTFTVVHNFGADDGNGFNADGEEPLASPVLGTDGNFYGTALGGGSHTYGTVYKMVVHPGGTLQFSSAAYKVNENAGSAFLTVTRAVHSAGAVTIQYATADGTAKAGTDYQSASGTLSWADGDLSSRMITVSIMDRGLFSGTHALSLLLSSPTGGADPGNPTTATLTINDNDPPPPVPSITSDAPPDGKVGVAYSFKIAATNSPTMYAATGLPPGVGINTVTGSISGTPTQPGSFAVNFSASNGGGIGKTSSYTVNIEPAPPIITSAASVSAQAGQPFSYQIAATNSPTNYNAPGLPAALNVNTATGVISGTPAQAGATVLTVSASNSGGTGTATLSLNFTTSPPAAVPVIYSAASDSAQVGQFYEYSILATNNPTSYSAPALPAGLHIDTISGVINGTPTAATGKYGIGLTASNTIGAGPSATFTLTVDPAPENIYGFNIVSPPSECQLPVNQPYTVYAQVQDIAGTLSSIALYVDDAQGGSTSLGSGSTELFYKPWTPQAPGNYVLRAVATDTAGNTKTSTVPVSVVSTAVSTVKVIDLSDKSFISGSELSLVTELVGNPDAPVDSVKLYAGGKYIGGPQLTEEVTVAHAFPPIYYRVNTATQLAFSALITKTNASTNASAGVVTYAVNTKLTLEDLTCEITAPADSALKDATATVKANTPLTATVHAVRKGGTVSKVEYYVNTGPPVTSTAAPFSVTLPAQPVGSYTLTAIATDSTGVSRQSAPVTVIVEGAPVVTSAATATAMEGKAFSYQIAASNSPTKYGASGLPSGLTINQTTGKISGTPATPGTYAVTIAAFNITGSGSRKLTLTVTAAPPAITSALSESAKVGSAFSYQIAATNNPTKYGESGLPAGLSIDQTSGKISGTPTKSGTYTVTIAAFNSAGSGSAKLTLTVAVGTPTITSSLSASAKVGSAFLYQIAATNSPTKYGESGLPAGLIVNQGTGKISGTPTKAGTYTVTIAAFNSLGSGSAKLTLVVK